MKIQLPCRVCKELGLSTPFIYSHVELEEDSTYRFTCKNGHDTACFLQMHQFQILFDLGMMAVLDGYTREAVSSLSASIERFYEYCLEVFLTGNGVTGAPFEETWKLVSNQTERQLGAYYFLYLHEFGRAPDKIKSSWISFRNDVIHKGHIPKQDKVMEYAEYVYNYMVLALVDLRERYEESVLSGWLERRKSEFTAANANTLLETIIYPTFIDVTMNLDDFRSTTLNQRQTSIDTYMEEMYQK